MRPILAGFVALALMAGCSSTQLQTFAKPATRERLYGNIKRIAVLPLDTLTEGASGPKNIENVLIEEILSQEVFDKVEEPRYINGLMKKLKLRNTESLDREVVQKIGQELQVDAIVVGALYLNTREEKSEQTEFSVFLTMLDVATGSTVWSGHSYVTSSTTVSEVFGLTQDPSINDLGTKGILKLAHELTGQFADARKIEYKLMIEDTKEEPEEAPPPAEPAKGAKKGEKGEGEVEELLLKVTPK